MNTFIGGSEEHANPCETSWIGRMLPRRFEAKLQFVLLLLIFLLNVVLVFPAFFPNLRDINTFDEASYINSGRELTEGILPTYANRPLTAFLYALAYIPVQASPYWLIHSCTIGRLVLFGLLWLGSCLIAKQISHLSHPLVMIGLLLVSPVLTRLITNSSHALFAAMSGFSFWQILSFHHSKKTRHLGASSAFLALAALSRSEGLILFLLLIPFCVLLGIRIKRIGASLAAWMIPFIIIVAGYVTLYGFSTGSFELGIAGKSYVPFEQGQRHAIEHLTPGQNPSVEGAVEARRLFGTPKENQYSVITAIRRNPTAYLERVVRTAGKVPKVVFSVYGGWPAVVFFLLAARGIVEMARKRLYLLLCILLLWPSYLLLNVLLTFRPTHFLSPFFIAYLLASVGLNSMLSNLGSKKEPFVWFTMFSGLGILGIVLNKSLLFTTSFVLLLGLCVLWVIMREYRDIGAIRPIGLVLVFCTVLLLKASPYYLPSDPFGRFRTLGIAPDEKAAVFMKEHLQRGTRVAALAPGNVWIAKMTHVPMSLGLRYMNSDQDLSAWLVDQKVEAIYVNKALRNSEPSVWALIERQIGKSFEVVFTSDDGDVQVLLVTTPH